MSNFNHERNEITSNNDNNSHGQKSLFTFFSNIKKKFKQVFVDLSDEENENNFQVKSDSFSVSNNLPYLYDAPSLNQNNDYKFYDNASFGNSNRKRVNLPKQAKEVSNFINERKNSDSEANYNPNLSLKEREFTLNTKRAHPLVKIINTILSSKYNLGPIEKETLPEKTSVFSYNSAFKPIITKSIEESNPDLILNNSYEKLTSLKKRNFLLNPSFISNSTSKSNYNLFRLDNTTLKPKAVRLWENNETQYNEGEKRLLSKKRSRYENDDYARFSPEYEKNYNWENRKYDIFNSSNRNSRQMKFAKDFEMEEKRKAYNDSRIQNDSKLTFSNVSLSGLKLNQLQQPYNQTQQNKQEKELIAINTKSNVNSFLNEDKNSLYSNQNLQDKNNVYFNKPIQPSNKNFKAEINLNNMNNNEINLSTIDNLNSSISSRHNNLDFYGNKGLKDKTLEEIRTELNEKKKANQKLLNEIHSKTKRSFRGENFGEDEFSHSSFTNKKLLGNKSYLKNFNTEEDEIVNYRNKNEEEVDNDAGFLDERRKKIADFYRNKDLVNKKDLDLISAGHVEYLGKRNKLNVFDDKRDKYEEDNFEAGKTFSFKNISNIKNKEKRSDDENEFMFNHIKSQNKDSHKEANLVESDKDSASFGGDESLKEKSRKSFGSQKSNKKGQAKPIENHKTLFGFNDKKNNENENVNKPNNAFNLFGTSSNNNLSNINQQKDITNIFRNKANNGVAEKEKEKQENINEIKKPSLFERRDDKEIEKANFKGLNNTAIGGVAEAKEISLPSNNNLFGASQETKPSIGLFSQNNQEKLKASDNIEDTNKNAFPIFNQMAKKSEVSNESQNEKPAKSKPLFGNFGGATTGLFSAANAIKPNSTSLFSEKKAEEKEKTIEENKAQSKIEVDNNNNKTLFSFGASNFASSNPNNSNSLFGASTGLFAGGKSESTNNKPLFSFAEPKDKKKDKDAEKKIEGESPKFAAESTKDENKPLAASIAPEPLKKVEPAAEVEKKENENINEFSSKKEEEKKDGKEASNSIGFKPTIPVSNVFNQGPSIPSIFANANIAPVFGKPVETEKPVVSALEAPKVEKEKEVAANKQDENANKSVSAPLPSANTTSSLFGNTGFNLFGNKEPVSPLFGASAEAPKPAATTSLFGNSNSLFSKPATTESTTSTSLFTAKPTEQTNNSNTSAPAQPANSSFTLFNANTQTSESIKPSGPSLFSTTKPTGTGLFGASAPQESKKTEVQKEQTTQATSSLSGNLQAKAPESTIFPAVTDSNKTSSLFGGASNLIGNKNDNTLTAKADSTFNLFGAKPNNENTSNLNTQSGLFSGLNQQAQTQTNNVFVAQPTQSKPSSIFSAVNNDKLGVSSGLGLTASNDLNSKNEPASNSVSIPTGEQQQQNKSLLNDKNPFLQKTGNTQNNLFTSSNSNQNTFSAQNNNANSNMNSQNNAFFVSSDKRNNGHRVDMGQGAIHNFGANLFPNENKSNANLNAFPAPTNSLFTQQNTNNGLFSNSSSLFVSNNAVNTNMGSSLFGTSNSFSGNSNAFNNNPSNNMNGGNNEDMNISPVRSPNLQPKFNNTNVNGLFGAPAITQPSTNGLFGNSGNLLNQSNTNNNAMIGGSGLFGNPNQNQGTLFSNPTANTQSGSGLFSNAPNFMNTNNNSNSLFGVGSGFSLGKK